MAGDISVESGIPLIGADVADHSGAGRAPYDPALATDPDIAIFRISGAFFFGTAAAVSASLERTGPRPKITIIDFSEAPMIDSTAAATIEGFARQAAKRGGSVLLCGAKAPIRRILLMQGVRPPLVRYRSTLADALATARARIERADA
jgi:SulP family sulfate permease